MISPRAVLLAASVIMVAGCGSASGGGVAQPPSKSPQSCHAQYEAWKHGPAHAEVDRFKSALRGVQSAGQAEDFPKLTAALHRAGRAATQLAATPPPRCADPKGYYRLLLARVTAAGDNARSAGGLGGVLLAVAPLKTVPGIEHKLGAELDATVGKNR